MGTVPRTDFTADQLLALPRGRHRYELVRGELRIMSPAGWRHGAVAARILAHLADHVQQHDLGVVFAAETGCYLERRPDTVRAADVSFVRRERMATLGQGPGFLRGAPDLAIEVLSPSDTAPEVREKVAAWLAAGRRLVWVVDPEQRCGEVHRAGVLPEQVGENGSFQSDEVVPGFELRLRDALAI
jgi:Uma2 family endonuclease